MSAPAQLDFKQHHLDETHHVVPLKIYFVVFGALMAGTAITVWAAFVDLGPMNTVVALSIAAVKATLVILFFMHVKYSSRLVWVFVLSGFLWLGILLSLTYADYVSRGWGSTPTGTVSSPR